MCPSVTVEHIPACSFPERSLVVGRGLIQWRGQAGTSGYSCSFRAYSFPAWQTRMDHHETSINQSEELHLMLVLIFHKITSF